MIIKSIGIDKVVAGHVLELDGNRPYVVVVRARKELRTLFKEAIRKQIYEKGNAEGQYRDILDYFKAMSDDAGFLKEVETTLEGIKSYLHQGVIFCFDGKKLEDYVMTNCSRLCALLVAGKTGGSFVDGTDLMVCEIVDGKAVIDWEQSSSNIRTRCLQNPVTVVSGGYARTNDGYTTKIGRGGADIMTTAIASVLGAERIDYYTTGNGINGVPEMTYEEAAHLSSSELGPIFPPAMWPAIKADIPIVVKNILDPSFGGTLISSKEIARPEGSFTGIVCSTDLELITVYGSGLLGSVGISSTLFSALAKAGVNIRFISQSSAEYSISIAVRKKDSERAMRAIKGMVSSDQYLTFNDICYITKDVAIVSVCGSAMRNVPGVSGKIYSALGDAGISIIAASQGGEEFSISVVVDSGMAEKAVEVLEKV